MPTLSSSSRSLIDGAVLATGDNENSVIITRSMATRQCDARHQRERYAALKNVNFVALAGHDIHHQMKVRDILRMLSEDGWYLAATRGSHRQYKNPLKPGRVTVPGKPNDDLAPGTLNSILKQAGLKK